MQKEKVLLVAVGVLGVVGVVSTVWLGSRPAATLAPVMVRIEAGSFTMGSPATEPGRDLDEVERTVMLTRDFWLSATEVTQDQWRAQLGTTPSYYVDCGGNCPVEQVSWLDAVRYANAQSAAEGLAPCYDGSGRVVGGATVYDCEGYRLPTEAEWEYAARGGTAEATYAGPMRIDGLNNAPVLSAIAVYAGNSGVTYANSFDCSGWPERPQPASTCGPHPVGGLAPNAYGLYDMLGNVSEWTSDVYVDLYATSPVGPATDPAGPETGLYRAFRGGSWFDPASKVRAAGTVAGDPALRLASLGFRLARTAR